MRIHLYVDGPRDEATIPLILETLLGEAIDVVESCPWSRLNQPRGYQKKVVFALVKARDAGVDAVVAVCDADKMPQRLAELKAGRADHRSKNAPYPAALGQANPHGEAWLLDDRTAIIRAWGLPPDTEIPTIRHCDRNPKRVIESLFALTGRYDQNDGLAEIARLLDSNRCVHKKETGFAQFLDEVRDELGPLRRSSPQ
ncbi:MAG: hypothetical protein U0800_18650 [Isosphaeraceae bacterium]